MFNHGLNLLALLAIGAAATPLHHQHTHKTQDKKIAARQSDTFQLTVKNNCGWTKYAGLYQISPSFDMIQMSDPVEVASGDTITIDAPYYETGMRLSSNANMGTAWQWNGQILFEFGYSSFDTVEGTAYDISMMEGSEIGMSVVPGTDACETKMCTPDNYPEAQCWTNADQTSSGSPADTTCYEGNQSFEITWCPS